MKANITIEGITPLLMNRFINDEELKQITSLKAEEQAERKAYRNKDTGELEVPSSNIISSLRSACQHTNINSNVFKGRIIYIKDRAISLNQYKFEVDSRTVKSRITRQRELCHRPMLNSWQLSFTLNFNEDAISIAELKELFYYAGSTIGIGDFRPQNGGNFGTFMLLKLESDFPE